MLLRCLFPRWEAISKRAKNKGIPQILSSVGDHIKKRRLEQGLFQKDVATLLNVCEETISGWETGLSSPFIENVPRIIAFLGYNPYSQEKETLGGKLKYYRLVNGINLRHLSRILGVDKSTLFSWESNKHVPKEIYLQKIYALIEMDGL